IVSFIIILSVLVLVHEFGHFITARMSGIKVEEFGLGYPPRIFGIKRGETTYSLNWVIFGGFTKLAGEEDPNVPRSMASKTHAVRFMVLVAGSVMNLILPIILFTASFMIPHTELFENVVITDVAQGSPAQEAGIVAGDRIMKIANNPINNRANISYYVQLNLGNPVDVVVQKADQAEKTYNITPRWKPPQGQGSLGVTISGTDNITKTVSMPFWEAIPRSFVHSWEIVVLYKNEITKWIIGSTSPQLTGPIGIAQLTGEVVRMGFAQILEFTSLISISLGIFNLFPFPGLDGGRIVFVALEWIRRGKRISPRKEGIVHTIGFALLLLLIVVISYFDVLRLISGASIIP
ncbi:MAG: RIP metalloprotease RseP, partial [Chloroflexi bacterium RBG_16_48_7]